MSRWVELAGLLQRRGARVKLLLYPGEHGQIPIDDIAAFLDASMRRPQRGA